MKPLSWGRGRGGGALGWRGRRGWRRNLCCYEGVGGGFAEDAGGVSGCVAVDLCSRGVGGGGGDVGGSEGGGVGDGHVSVDSAQEGGVAGGDLVEVGAGGEFVAG